MDLSKSIHTKAYLVCAKIIQTCLQITELIESARRCISELKHSAGAPTSPHFIGSCYFSYPYKSREAEV